MTTKLTWKNNRIVGCQSLNHTTCNEHTQELWQCAHCGRWFCDDEGSAVDAAFINWCDDCWLEAEEPKRWVKIQKERKGSAHLTQRNDQFYA